MSSRYKLIGCGVLREEAQTLMNALGVSGRIDADWLETGLHARPDALREELARRVAACGGGGYDAILLLYGLCGRATEGLSPPEGTALVIPRVHDCVALHLGSAAAVLDELAAEAGTYWFSRGYLAGCESMDDVRRRIGGGDLEDLRRRYGEEEGEYLYAALHGNWRRAYRRGVYVRWHGNPRADREEEWAREFARENGWRFETRSIDLRLVRKLLLGEWDDEFVVARPGQRLAQSGDTPPK